MAADVPNTPSTHSNRSASRHRNRSNKNQSFDIVGFLAQGNDIKSPISVDDYPEILVVDHDRETTTPATSTSGNFVDLDGNIENDGDVVVLGGRIRDFTKEPRRSARLMRRLSVSEIGESSSSSSDSVVDLVDPPIPPPLPTSFCAICMEPKMLSESFGMTGCSHMFCADCIKQYISAKIQDNVAKISCPSPNCKEGFLEPERCSSILPPEVFERWCCTLCESLLLDSTRLYCPFKDCSAPLLDEAYGTADADDVVRESECPYCWRLFCAQCKVPWHAEIACEDFQKLRVDERDPEDIMLVKMAKSKKWQRCPKCRFFVERTEGCRFMKCRCKYIFCYGCGTEMIEDHYCKKCKR